MDLPASGGFQPNTGRQAALALGMAQGQWHMAAAVAMASGTCTTTKMATDTAITMGTIGYDHGHEHGWLQRRGSVRGFVVRNP